MRDKRLIIAAATVMAASAALYVATLPRTVSFSDSAEFVTAAATLGIAHPSGYPLYVLIGKLFSLFPGGTVPWRVTLLSAVSAALCLGLLMLIASRSTGAKRPEGAITIAVFVSFLLQLAVSPLMWTQAIFAKPYTLHLLLIGVVTWALISYLEQPTRRRLLMLGFTLGLAAANHLFMTLAVLPFLLFSIIVSEKRILTSLWRIMLLGATALASAAPFYLLMLLRARSDPPFAFGLPRTLGALLKYAFRGNYHDLAFGGTANAALLIDFCRLLLENLGPLILILALVGLATFFLDPDRRRAALGIWLGGVVVFPALILLFRDYGFDEVAASTFEQYLLPSVAFSALLAMIGAIRVVGFAKERLSAGRLALIGSALILFLISTVIVSVPRVRLTTDPFVEDWTRNLLLSLPENAVFLPSENAAIEDTLLFSLAYLKTVEQTRPDVTIITESGIRPFRIFSFPEGYEHLPLAIRRARQYEKMKTLPESAGRPLVTSFPTEILGQGDRSVSNGYAYVSEGAGWTGAARIQVASGTGHPAAISDSPWLSVYVSHALYTQATGLMDRATGQTDNSLILQAIDLDLFAQSEDYQGLIAYRLGWTAKAP